ncbi:HBR013Wp [Eremothecium sinecaudum]|uniref:HECT-type E3 ubiquitin transferase n=1 Tax=Eremothecium sinecaudum TaxID=45286 RepID=A0A120K116_9SACH|nr:HBR013Wp [Eremothecium sinecaudum]AMD18914.1 HBR013Wp [Eremothecium sinecaudum]
MNRGEEFYEHDSDYAISSEHEEGSRDDGGYSYQEEEEEEDDDDDDDEEEDDEYSNFYDEYEEDGGEHLNGAEDNEEEEDIDEVISPGRAAADGNADRWVSSLQELLGTLAQGMEGRRTTEEGHGQQRINLTDVFPEYRQMFGIMGGVNRNDGGRMQKLVSNVLNATEEPFVAMESLREINEQLLMLNPLTAERTVPQMDLLKGIVNALDNPALFEELELQLIACRCLYNLFEVNPDVVSAAVDRNVISILQKKLEEISYIDLAEQVLETLEYISRLSGKEILNSGCLVQCLQYVDFFTVHAQRKAVTIVANSCARVKSSDYDQIVRFFPLLKGLFINSNDQGILTKVLNALYAICGAMSSGSKHSIETLVDLEIIKRIVDVVSSSDIELDGKLKSLDILSLLVSTSSTICTNIIESCDISSMVVRCLNKYKKSVTSSLHEMLMFVPKPLLISITRFVALLLPTEEEQVLSVDPPKYLDIDPKSEKFLDLVKKIIPFFAEIYLNTVDFDIRRYILISLARIASFMNSDSSYIDKQLIGLLSPSIAQNKSSYEAKEGDKIVSGGLLIGLLSLSSTMIAKCASNILPDLKREGIFEMLKSLSAYWNQESDRNVAHNNSSSQVAYSANNDDDDDMHTSTGLPSSPVEVEVEEAEDDDVEDDDYDMEIGPNVDISHHVKPKKINFTVFRNLNASYVDKKLKQLCYSLVESFSCSEESVMIKELKEIEELVSYLRMVDNNVEDSEYWQRTWIAVKNTIFREDFTISGFEFISTGLSESISKIIKSHPSKNSTCQIMFIRVFSDKLELLVKTLQSALTKLESFEIIDCGSSENRAASLGKQMKIRLEYIGDIKKDDIPSALSTLMVSIHCISSFKSLCEFLKHRVAQSRFLSSLLPMSHQNADVNSDDVKTLLFEFQVNGEIVKSSETIFGSIFKNMSSFNRDPRKAWNEVQTIKYRRVYEDEEEPNIGRLYPENNFSREELKPIDGILDLLACCHNGAVNPAHFINPKLTMKLSRQLEEPLIVASGALPSWTLNVTRYYSFLFPLDVRILFLQNTSFGYGRLIQLWKERIENEKNSVVDEQLQRLGRPTRHKLRIARETIFLSALKILTKYGSSPNILEIEYQDEVGTGMGPTLEFYSSVSKEFARKSLHMWHIGSDNEGEYISGLLYPGPISPSQDRAKVLELFTHLGTFVARSMLDNRIVDFRFNRVFFELMHSKIKNEPLDFNSTEKMFKLLGAIDPQLESSLRYIHTHRDSETLEALSLNFTVPGYDIDLIEGGSSTAITTSNVDLYSSKLFDAFLGSGVESQLSNFIDGFSKAFPYSSLLVFAPSELSDLFGSVEEDWSTETLFSFIMADHGYTMDSPTLHDLIVVMSSFSLEERRNFLQFLTGSPKLPMGGFKNLKPHLTVVLKQPEGDLTSDQYLPSVMTCANYLKLPKYSNREILRARIIQAINEGSGAFLLS